MHIGFIVDHPRRDLPGGVMLGYAAAKRGMRFSLIPMYEQAVDVPLLGLDALIVNYARPANRDLLEGYSAYGLPVFVLDTEGGIMAAEGANSLEGLPRLIGESGVEKYLAGYLFWGERQRDAFLATGFFPKGKLYVTGCPRFDFASPKWSATLKFSRSGYILVNANFSLVNSRFSRPEEEISGMEKFGWERDYLRAIYADWREMQKGFVSAVATAARRFPAREFLFRPHPFERAEFYGPHFTGLPNLTIDPRGDVLTVIQNSAAVLHLNCGTSVEATMLRRLPVSLEFLNTDRMRKHVVLPSKISFRAESAEMLHETIENLDEATAAFDFEGTYASEIFPWFHYNDGAASERVLDVVSGAAREKGPRMSLRWSLSASRITSRAAQRLQAALANAMGSYAVSGLRTLLAPIRREKRFTWATVNSMISALAQHEACATPSVLRARHPNTGMPLASLSIMP